MVEAIANGVEDKLIDGLSFKLAPGASYVTNRRSVTFYPTGSNIYKPGSGTRLIKFQLTGDDWLDTSTLRVAFDVANNSGTQKMVVVGEPHTFFRRLRVLIGGQILEDIDNYNRVHEMFQCLKNKDSRANDVSEGFGNLIPTNGTFMANGIDANQKQTVIFKPLAGIILQPKFLPLRYAHLTFELELVSSADEVVLSDATNLSNNWQMENVQIKCDVITLDSGLEDSFKAHLLSGKSMPINYNTLISQMQTIKGQTKPSINVTRALSRLKSVFVTLDKDVSADGADADMINGQLYRGKKPWNIFWSPMSNDNDVPGPSMKHNPAGEIQRFYIQVGSKLFPEFPIQSHAEAFYQLKKTLGIQSSNVHSFDISAREYRDNKMILAIDAEKVLDAGWTGLNTRAGDLMNVVFEYVTGVADNRKADRMHIVLHADIVVEIRENGVTIFD